MKAEKPYIETKKVVIERAYNPNYGDNKYCKCGHVYHRHFDSYENMDPVGCKYCNCYLFKPMKKCIYLVRMNDYAIFELDPSNGCYRIYEQPGKEKENRPNAQSHFTFTNLTENYNFIPIKKKEIPQWIKRHDYELGFRIWQCRNDGHGGAKGGDRYEYAKYLEDVERYQKSKEL